MKSVSFLRNTWRRKESKTSDDLEPSRSDPSHASSFAQGTTSSQSAELPLQTDPALHCGGESSGSHSFSGNTGQSRTPDRIPSQHGATQPLEGHPQELYQVRYSTEHGAPPSFSHGPPMNARHGPPNKNPQHSVFSFIPRNWSSENLTPPQRPPRPAPLNFDPPPQRHVASSASLSSSLRVRFASSPETTVSHPSSPTGSPLRRLFRPKGCMPEVQEVLYETPENDSTDSDSSTPKAIGFFEGKVVDDSAVYHHKATANYRFSDDHFTANVYTTTAHTQTRSEALMPPHAFSAPTTPFQPRSLYRKSGSTSLLDHFESESEPSPVRPVVSQKLSRHHRDEPEFSLSLFPAPPPLVIRKKHPNPLVLRANPTIVPLPPSPSVSSFSSPDSTPLGTPTSPHFPSMLSTSSRSTTPSSPACLKTRTRSLSNMSPPPSSPPTSPLPSPPVSPRMYKSVVTSRLMPVTKPRPLRIARSASNLRIEVIPSFAAHRTTSSDSTSDSPSSERYHRQAFTSSYDNQTEEMPSIPASRKGSAPAILTETQEPVHWGIAV